MFETETHFKIKMSGSENESHERQQLLDELIDVTISRGTQTEVNWAGQSGTQTELLYTDTSILVSMANLANRFLHAAYWFSIVEIVFTSFSNRHLQDLARNVQLRQSASKASAKKLLSHLLARDFLKLADIAKPDFTAAECSAGKAVKIIAELDQWLLDSSELVLHSAKEKGNLAQVELLQQIVEEQKIFDEFLCDY